MRRLLDACRRWLGLPVRVGSAGRTPAEELLTSYLKTWGLEYMAEPMWEAYQKSNNLDDVIELLAVGNWIPR